VDTLVRASVRAHARGALGGCFEATRNPASSSAARRRAGAAARRQRPGVARSDRCCPARGHRPGAIDAKPLIHRECALARVLDCLSHRPAGAL